METYDFHSVTSCIDELLLLDVSTGPRLSPPFLADVSRLAQSLFIPIGVGGGVTTLSKAERLLESGADKILINSQLVRDANSVKHIAAAIGKQSVVASVDWRHSARHRFSAFIDSGRTEVGSLTEVLTAIGDIVGELLLNGIDRDGTGNGIDLEVVEAVPTNFDRPIIIMGGIGTPAHLVEALTTPRVNAVATANLLNFVGDALRLARDTIAESGIQLPSWIPVSALPSEIQSRNQLQW